MDLSKLLGTIDLKSLNSLLMTSVAAHADVQFTYQHVV